MLSGNSSLPCQTLNHRTKNHETIRGAESRLGGALGMRHQSDHVALTVAQARNRMEGAIRVRLEIIGPGVPSVRMDVAENDLFVAFELGERGRIAEIVSFHVRDGHFQNLTGTRGAG